MVAQMPQELVDWPPFSGGSTEATDAVKRAAAVLAEFKRFKTDIYQQLLVQLAEIRTMGDVFLTVYGEDAQKPLTKFNPLGVPEHWAQRLLVKEQEARTSPLQFTNEEVEDIMSQAGSNHGSANDGVSPLPGPPPAQL